MTDNNGSVVKLSPIASKSPLAGGKFKDDLYYNVGNNNHQFLFTYQTKPVKSLFGDYSLAIGTDYKLEEGYKQRKTIFDLYSSYPIDSSFSIDGRLRTSYCDENPTTQARLGLNFKHPITDRVDLYNLMYAKERCNFKKNNTDFTVGDFLGISAELSDNWSACAEVELTDLQNIKKNNLYFNFGLRYKFN